MGIQPPPPGLGYVTPPHQITYVSNEPPPPPGKNYYAALSPGDFDQNGTLATHGYSIIAEDDQEEMPVEGNPENPMEFDLSQLSAGVDQDTLMAQLAFFQLNNDNAPLAQLEIGEVFDLFDEVAYPEQQNNNI